MKAAGGVIIRDGEVAVVHRPRYDDWTLPKGKLDPDESFEEAALREVGRKPACYAGSCASSHRWPTATRVDARRSCATG